MDKKISFIKSFKRGNQIVKGHYRKNQTTTFDKGYEKAYNEISSKIIIEGCCTNCLAKRKIRIDKGLHIINPKCQKCNSRMFEFFKDDVIVEKGEEQ